MKTIVQKNDRLILVKIETELCDIAIIQVYMPTSQYSDEEVESMYEEIEEMMGNVNGQDSLVVMGDWNAVVGEARQGKEIGSYGSGVQNNRGKRLQEFCEQNQLVLTNTWYEQPKRRRYTWKSPGDRHRYQNDYVMVKQRYRNSVIKACS